MAIHSDLRDHSHPHPATTLYSGPDVIVTWHWVQVPGNRYRIADLSDVVRMRGTWHVGVYVVLSLAGVDVLLVVPAAVVAGSLTMLVLAVGAVLTLYLAAWVCWHGWRPRQELWAHCQGSMVRLFGSRDSRTFGQASRAVQRAMEAVQRDWP